MIVRWALAELPEALAAIGVEHPFVVAGPRWDAHVPATAAGRLSELPSDRIEVPAAADCLLAVGGGSAIDTAKAGSAATGLPLVCVPTTYSGAEWPRSFGVRTRERRIVGHGTGSNTVAIVYDVGLTLDLPLPVTVGNTSPLLNNDR